MEEENIKFDQIKENSEIRWFLGDESKINQSISRSSINKFSVKSKNINK